MAGSHHPCYGHELGQISGGGERQRGLVCYSPWGHKESDMTRQLNNTLSKALPKATTWLAFCLPSQSHQLDHPPRMSPPALIFFFFLGCAGSSLLQGLFSSCRGNSLVAVLEFLTAVASLWWNMGFKACGLQ